MFGWKGWGRRVTFVCPAGVYPPVCVRTFPLFVLGTDKQGVDQIVSPLCACGGSDQDGSGCPPRIYLRRLCAVLLQFCVSIRTSAPCERFSPLSTMYDAVHDWISSYGRQYVLTTTCTENISHPREVDAFG